MTLRVICKILRHRPCHNFLPGVLCVAQGHRGLPVMVHDMHTRRRKPDYLPACPTGPPVEGVKSALTPALCGPVPSDPRSYHIERPAECLWQIDTRIGRCQSRDYGIGEFGRHPGIRSVLISNPQSSSSSIAWMGYCDPDMAVSK